MSASDPEESAKLNIAFAMTHRPVQRHPRSAAAGNILRANPSYPGAAAQAGTLSRRGMMTRAIHAIARQPGPALARQ